MLLVVFFIVVALVLWAPVVRLPLHEQSSSLARNGLVRLLFLQHPPWHANAEDNMHGKRCRRVNSGCKERAREQGKGSAIITVKRRSGLCNSAGDSQCVELNTERTRK